jgi:hypothetical protein
MLVRGGEVLVVVGAIVEVVVVGATGAAGAAVALSRAATEPAQVAAGATVPLEFVFHATRKSLFGTL